MCSGAFLQNDTVNLLVIAARLKVKGMLREPKVAQSVFMQSILSN